MSLECLAKEIFRVNISEQVGTIKVWFPLMVLTSQISGLGPRTITAVIYVHFLVTMGV